MNATTHIITFNIDNSREEQRTRPLISTKTPPPSVNISYKITPEVVKEGDPKLDKWNLYLEIQYKKKKQCYLTHDRRPVRL